MNSLLLDCVLKKKENYNEFVSNGSYEKIVSGGPIAKGIPSSLGGVIESYVHFPWADVEKEKDLEGHGDSITFHGAIDIQQLLPYATEEEVRREVKRIISVLGENGGYILAPTHALQADTPIENIIAMYEEAQGRKISKDDSKCN